MQTRIPLLLTCMVLFASVPFVTAQDDGGDADAQITFDGGRAEGRFVAFDVDAEAGAVCGWAFEGKTVIDAMTGVSGNARAEGRVVLMDGGSSASDGACQAEADVGSDAPQDDGGDDGDAGSASPTGTSSGTNGEDEGDDQDGLDEEDNDSTQTSAGPTSSATSATPSSSQARVAAAKVKLHDNPRGAITIDLEAGQTVHLDLASGLAIRADGDKVRIEGDGLSASLFLAKGAGDVDVSVRGSTIRLDAEAAAKVHFRVGDGDLKEDDREAVDDTVDDGDVSCEVFVSDDDQPDVVVLDDANVTIRATHTAVRVDLDVDIDVDIDLGSETDSDGEPSSTSGSPPTATRSATQSRTATRTQTGDGGAGGDDDGDGGDGGSHDDDGNGADCGCAAKVIILDVDVTVFVLEADDDLLVSLDGVLLARADSIEDALNIQAGEDPEALVVVDKDDEVKVITSLGTGSSQLSLQAQGGEEFRTREPVRYTHTTTLGYDGDDFADDLAADPDSQSGGADASGAPGLGLGAVLLALAVVTLIAARRRLE